ncbi:hypothetical protein [Agrobacterium sp. NPDC090273]|uniref:hypothetical protein n=1 Tax=Agrobacterium sp. NPDC090273 TaxID=3363919 RepID=UPI00383B101F
MDFISAQTRVVETVVPCIGVDGWEQIFIDAEIAEDENDYSLSTVSFAIVRAEDGQPAKHPFSIDAAGQDAMLALYAQRHEAGDEITGFDLTIEPDDRFRFRFSHDEPKRALGKWDAAKAARLQNYLGQYDKAGRQT